MNNRTRTITALTFAPAILLLAACGTTATTTATEPTTTTTTGGNINTNQYYNADPPTIAVAIGCSDNYTHPTADPDDALTDAEYTDRYGIERDPAPVEGEPNYGRLKGSCTINGTKVSIDTFTTQASADATVTYGKLMGPAFFIRPTYIVVADGALITTTDEAIANTAANTLGTNLIVRINPA